MKEHDEIEEELSRALKRSAQKIVFAESCTAGLVAAMLARIPGASDFLCGSAVTYRSQTKVAWLQIPADQINQFTAVSRDVTESMARQVLDRTPEASLAAAVTGHLGPDAPPDLDGVIFISIAARSANQITTERHQLSNTGRQQRQHEAARMVLTASLKMIESIDRAADDGAE